MTSYTEKENLMFSHPFTCLLAGPTGSRKTYFVRNLLENAKQLITAVDSDNPLDVMWCYGINQDLYNKPLRNVQICYIQGLPSDDDIESFKPAILILDDLMQESGGDKRLSDLFTKGSHHKGYSVIISDPVTRVLSFCHSSNIR